MLPPIGYVWQYTDAEGYRDVLAAESSDIMDGIYHGTIKPHAITDTRSLHCKLFFKLTPAGMEYYAGHYRGEDYPNLKLCPMYIANHKGTRPEYVVAQMSSLGDIIRHVIARMDDAAKMHDTWVEPELKLYYLVAALCRVFVDFLIIHPYADGNGHTSRIVLIYLFYRYGYMMQDFDVDPRPKSSNYTKGIQEYRQGNHEVLEMYIMSCLLPADSAASN